MKVHRIINNGIPQLTEILVEISSLKKMNSWFINFVLQYNKELFTTMNSDHINRIRSFAKSDPAAKPK
jgi:hypothetical protein